jgi:hypothetical protein
MLATFAVVLLMANPAAAATPAIKRFSPPYVTAKGIATTTVGGAGGVTHASHPPSANLTTGRVAMGFSVSHNSTGRCTIFRLCTHLFGYAGFTIPFNVSSAGAYSVAANWSITWSAKASCKHCSYGTETVALYVYSRIIYVSNASYVVANISQLMLLSYSGNSSTIQSGSTRLVVHLSANLVSGTPYEVITYIDRRVYANPPIGGLAYAELGTAAPVQGTLHWVTIR